ncbi:hypothetical protein RO1_03130 [Roseburia intestinalis XB6B4]|uniref:Uncharacterized protein n=1 Tax=Roseburia intestinalis XB6B4 TaxID=718255 RepID=D4KUR5_9FIRM|nr:hypothetical protein RO1_03130 [Roseburia intestinalis XB6B4]
MLNFIKCTGLCAAKLCKVENGMKK